MTSEVTRDTPGAVQVADGSGGMRWMVLDGKISEKQHDALSVFDHLAISLLERIAVALETLASDVRPAEPITGIFTAAADMGRRVAEAQGAELAASRSEAEGAKTILQEIAEKVLEDRASRQAQDEALKQKILEAPAATPVKPIAPTNHEAKALDEAIRPRALGADTVAAVLETELAAQEDAKAELGEELHALIWGVPHDAPAPLPVALKVRDAALKILGGEDAFAKVREALGVARGKIPTGAQMRRLAVGFLAPRLKSEAAQAGDSWA